LHATVTVAEGEHLFEERGVGGVVVAFSEEVVGACEGGVGFELVVPVETWFLSGDRGTEESLGVLVDG
jgi:hypothetical protein